MESEGVWIPPTPRKPIPVGCGDFIERDGVWIPPTPAKPIPVGCCDSIKRDSVQGCGESMERDSVWIPPTPAKPIPARSEHNSETASTSTQGSEKENINEAFPCTGSLSTTEFLEGKDHKSTATVQHETIGMQEEAECDGKKAAHGDHESQVGTDSVPTPSKTNNSRKRRDNGVDLNKKPSQRVRMKKHRPKVYDDSKPKKVPKAPQTPRSSPSKPKTPNKVQERKRRSKKDKFTESTSIQNSTTQDVETICRASIIALNPCKHPLDFNHLLVERDSPHVQERKRHSKKDKFTGSTSMQISTTQDVEETSRTSIIALNSCKRALDFNHLPVERDSPHVSKSHEEYPSCLILELRELNHVGKIVTSRRNTPRKSRFQNKRLKGSEDMFGDNNKQQRGLDISVIRNIEKAKKNVRRYDCVYQHQKKRSSKKSSYTSTLQVYQRTFRLNQCLQNSKKSGPNFPRMFKKQRTMRKKLTFSGNWLRIFLKDVTSHIKRPYRKRIQTTRKKVNKSQAKKEVAKQNLCEDKCVIPLFVFKKKKRSIRPTRRRKNLVDFPIFKEVPDVNDNNNDKENESFLLCQEENFLQIIECLPLKEVPVHEIENFTSLHWDVNGVYNSVGTLEWQQLQEIPVLENQTLMIPRQQNNDLYVREFTEILITRIANLDINAPCKELVVRNHNNNVSGALVKISPKKRKFLAKVDLDEETLRVWKLVMENNGSDPFEETDKDKAEWWEKQRNIFRGRVDSFIAKMHLIQGNRRFSPWKGSVVDSVVGVYLTQNVSDHLSSSAFMALAARFPVKSRSKEVDDDHVEVVNSQESVRSNTEVFGGFSNNNEIEEYTSTSCVNETDVTPTKELKQTETSNSSNSILVQDESCVGENPHTFRKLLEIQEVEYLKKFCSFDIDESSLNKTTFNGDMSTTKKDEGDEHLNHSEEPNIVAPVYSLQSEVNHEVMSTTEKDEGDEHLNHSEEPNIVAPVYSLQSEVNHEVMSTTEKDEGDEHLNHSEEPNIVAPVYSLQSEVNHETIETGKKKIKTDEKQQVKIDWCDSAQEIAKTIVERRMNNVLNKTTFNGDMCTTEKHLNHSEEPKIVAPVYSLQSEVNHEMIKTGKKKIKTEEKQEVKIDWEKWRETYCQIGGKETNEDNMDAVDWDAVRRASVQEIAKIIVDRGMNNVLAARIKEFLERMVKDHGKIDLEWLRDVPPDKAKEFLLSIQGIGLKSVECVRLLTLHHHAFPVDTNVARVATRLGWVPLQPLPEEVQIHLLNAYPMMDTIQKYLFPRICTIDQKTLYELHYQLITFGKVFCTKIKPNCNACPMRAECRHYASAFASARLALPGPKASSSVTAIIPATAPPPPPPPPPPPSSIMELNNSDSSYHAEICEPIIEVPPSPEPYVEQNLPDIEDYFHESDDEIPTIRLNTEEFKETLKETIDANNIRLPEGDDMSKAIVALSVEAAHVRVRPMKFVAKLRTVHIVYELPDYHPCLAGFDKREAEDPSRYLLAIWPECASSKDAQEETVKGTILIPCRTANRGKFPLNGTYFQVNEVFADDETSMVPMDVPRHLLWNLPRRDLGCGTSATSIFKALSTGDIQHIFWRGSICVRGFNRKTRQPRPLHRRFHVSTAVIAADNKKLGKRGGGGGGMAEKGGGVHW